MKTTSASATTTPAVVERFALFGSPSLLDGEDAASYYDMLGRVCAAVKPVDIIDEMLVTDIVYLQWDLLRLRRFKASLLRAPGREMLKDQLERDLDFHFYADVFERDLAAILKKIPGPHVDQADMLAQQVRRNDKGASQVVAEVLKKAAHHIVIASIRDEAKCKKQKLLLRKYFQRDPEATKQINQILAGWGITIDDLVADVFTAVRDAEHGKGPNPLEALERLDRLAATAEARRNAALRELDRHRAALAHTTREALQDIEEAELILVPERATPRLAATDSESASSSAEPRPVASTAPSS